MENNIENNQFELTLLPDNIIEQCEETAIRQSLMGDYATCPQMAFYTWIMKSEKRPPFMAAILGSAGHKVIEVMHATRNFKMPRLDIMDLFEKSFREELEQQSLYPNHAAKFDSIEDELSSKIPEYTKYLRGYQAHERNQNFISFLHEQRFVIQLPSPFPDMPKPFIFTGTIDQLGIYADTALHAVRDIKFRDNAFKPSGIGIKLNTQLTVYAFAARHGDPVCDECAPTYEQDISTGKYEIKYDGPCSSCKGLKESKKWPVRWYDKVELIWMRDFEQYTEDKFPKERKATAKDKIPKIKDPKGTNRMVYPMIANEKWIEGPKEGDFKGEGFISADRSPSQLKVLMGDVLRMAYAIRKGSFYRKPGAHCGFWCNHVEDCLGGVEASVHELDLSATVDFAGDF